MFSSVKVLFEVWQRRLQWLRVEPRCELNPHLTGLIQFLLDGPKGCLDHLTRTRMRTAGTSQIASTLSLAT